jgi:hypothetical protein
MKAKGIIFSTRIFWNPNLETTAQKKEPPDAKTKGVFGDGTGTYMIPGPCGSS